MNCPFCGTVHSEPTSRCRRCASPLPESLCEGCGISLEWGQTHCSLCAPELEAEEELDQCPACGAENHAEADYCAQCGSPMAVITRIVKLGDPDELDPWRVYGVETTMVGRDDELKKLTDTLDYVAQHSQAHLAMISGGEGLGKSRLVAEFERQLETAFSPTVILRGVCREEVSGAFAVISRMLRKHFYIPESASPDVARRGLSQAVQSLVGGDARHIVHHLGEVMGLGMDDDEITNQVSPRDQETAAFRAIETVLRADASRNPILFILDDVHLASDTTLRLLMHLIEKLRDSPVFFVFTWLTGSRRVIPPRTAHVEIELKPLSDSEVRRHITDTLRLAESIPESLIESIVGAALGNPLAVEELLRILIAEAVIDTRQEPWKIDASRADQIEIPTTVEATVEARLKGLTAEERQALEMAACVGRIFWAELLRCLDGLRRRPESDGEKAWLEVDGRKDPIDNVLESLERKDMVRRHPHSRIGTHEEYAFKHRLERETLYDNLSPRVRQRYHRFIAQWVERELTSLSDGAAEFVARHFVKARCLRRAAKYFLEAGDQARKHHANRKAIDLYLEALGCLSDADMDLKLRAFHDIGSVFELLGEHDQAMTYYRDMARYAWLLGDRGKGGAALNKIGRSLRGLGHYDEAIDRLERALKLFRRIGDERGVASTLDDIGKIHWIRGDQSRALEYYTAALEMRRSLDDRRSIALSLSHVGSLHSQRGDFREALALLKEALEIRKSIGDTQGAASSYNDLAGLCVDQGQYEKSLTLFDEALQMARDIGFRGLEAAALNNRGEALLALKRRDEARDHLLKAKDIAQQIGEQRVLFDVTRNLAHMAVSQADRTLALERIADALNIARRLGSKTLIALAELTRAEIHAEYIFDLSLRESSLKEAARGFERAVELFEETGNHVHRGQALLSLGNFLVEAGDVTRGKAVLQKAAAHFEGLGMKQRLAETQGTLSSL